MGSCMSCCKAMMGHGANCTCNKCTRGASGACSKCANPQCTGQCAAGSHGMQWHRHPIVACCVLRWKCYLVNALLTEMTSPNDYRTYIRNWLIHRFDECEVSGTKEIYFKTSLNDWNLEIFICEGSAPHPIQISKMYYPRNVKAKWMCPTTVQLSI